MVCPCLSNNLERTESCETREKDKRVFVESLEVIVHETESPRSSATDNNER